MPDSDHSDRSTWLPDVSTRDIGIWLGALALFVYLLQSAIRYGPMLWSAGLPERWTLANIAAYGFAVFSVVLWVGFAVWLVAYGLRAWRSRSEMEEIVEESEQSADEPGVVFEFDDSEPDTESDEATEPANKESGRSASE